jgi:hypothetical protein
VGGAATLSLPYTVNFGETVATPSIVQDVPTAAVAVKSPPAVIVPHFALQITGAEAVNCWVCPGDVVAETGVITIGETIVRLDVAVPLPSVAVAFMVQAVLGYSGALKSPAEVIVPQVVVQVDGTLALNCSVAFSWIVAEVGTTFNAKAGRHMKIKRKARMRDEEQPIVDLRAKNGGLEPGKKAASCDFSNSFVEEKDETPLRSRNN